MYYKRCIFIVEKRTILHVGIEKVAIVNVLQLEAVRRHASSLPL